MVQEMLNTAGEQWRDEKEGKIGIDLIWDYLAFVLCW